MSNQDTDALNLQPTDSSHNRGLDNKITSKDAPQLMVTLEKINEILVAHLTDTIKPTVVDGDIVRSVPVMYGTPERWKTVQKDGFFRDPASTKILTPLIMLRRTKEARTQLSNPVNKYLYRTLTSGWNRRNVYDRFAIQNGIRPSQQMLNVVVPDYIDLTYEFLLWTDYQQQMDFLIEQINFENDEYWGTRNNWKFRVKIDEYESESDLPADQDRLIRTRFQMTVSAYLLPESMVKDFHTIATNQKAYTAKKVIAIVETTGSL